MTNLGFSILDVRPERYAAVPTMLFRLRIEERAGEKIHAIALRAQVRIEARRRPYTAGEQQNLFELFGAPEDWGRNLGSLLWTNLVVMVPEFEGSVEVDLPVPCTYDLEVTAAKYFQALQDGEIPLLFLFSGTAFARAANGFRIEQVPWDREAACRLPVRAWRELMDRYFPECGWLRLRRDTLEALQRFKARNALLTWDETIEALVGEVAR